MSAQKVIKDPECVYGAFVVSDARSDAFINSHDIRGIAEWAKENGAAMDNPVPDSIVNRFKRQQ